MQRSRGNEMYADFAFYQEEYGGTLLKEEEYGRYEKKAARRLDAITGKKLTFAFPEKEYDADAVKTCVCEMAEFLKKVDLQEQAAAAGTIENADGTVQGKVIKSVTSGTESVSYSADSGIATTASEAVKDRKVMDKILCDVARENLTGITDANGVLLLYAGPYPGRMEKWE